MPLSDYRTALVTGASSGIGDATVRALAKRGIKVTALARRVERLDALAKATGCAILALDVRDTKALYRALDGVAVDIVVNNAGIGRGMGELFRARPEDIDTTTETNVSAVIHLLRALLPGMVERKRGHVVNVGSVAGLHPVKSAIYGASKAAVHLLSQNLRIELLGSGVRVTEICPGRVKTGFFDVAYDRPEDAERARTGFTLLEPEDIAESILYALDTPWRVNVATIEILPTEQVMGGVQMKPVAR